MHVSQTIDPSCYGCLIVTPHGRFTRKPNAIPKNWKGLRWKVYATSSKRFAQRQVDTYNQTAIKRGWSTWAILWHDLDRERLAQAGEDAKVLIPEVIRGKRSENHGTGLDLSACAWSTGDGTISITLDCGCLHFPDWKNVDANQLRQMAMEQVEKTLAAVKAAITQKPRRKRHAA